MEQMSKDEFSKYFNENYRSKLEDLEKKRLFYAPLRKFCLIFGVSLFIFIFIVGINMGENTVLGHFLVLCFCLLILSFLTVGVIDSLFKKPLKTKIISKVISLYGNLYLTNQKNLIRLSDIHNFGLFPRSKKMVEDDVIIGNYKNTNIVISECKLSHIIRSGKKTRTEIDFSGLIVKLTMNKKFSGLTVVGMADDITPPSGCKNVELESVEFMKNRKVYSSDQIEARYLLTPTFMERLDNLGKHFFVSMTQNIATEQGAAVDMNKSMQLLKSSNSMIANFAISMLDKMLRVSAVFVDGSIYLFIPLSMDFFEVSIEKSFLDPAQYYTIYLQINSILEIIEYFKLDQKLGL